MHVIAINNNNKEAKNMKKTWEILEQGKGREKCCSYIIISKHFLKFCRHSKSKFYFVFCIFSLVFLLGEKYCDVKFDEIPLNVEESHCPFGFGNCKENWASSFCVVE